MADALYCKQFKAGSIVKLIDGILAAYDAVPQSPSSSSEEQNSVLFFWGPPGVAHSEVQVGLGRLPAAIQAIGCSALEHIHDGTYLTAGSSGNLWTATLIVSKYITVECQGVDFDDYAGDDEQLKLGVDDYLRRFSTSVQSQYFTKGTPPKIIGTGFNGVRYRRPAVMTLFLPGLGSEDVSAWPSKNRDYDIVAYLAPQLSWNIGVIGGTAAGGFEQNAWRPQWHAFKTAEGTTACLRNSLVGACIQTDLNFGMASDHGMEPNQGKSFRVSDRNASEPVDDAIARAIGGPLQFHKARVLSMPANVTVLNPPSNGSDLVDKKLDEQPMLFLLNAEYGQFLPNPPYSEVDGGNVYQFSRPVPKGGAFFEAELTSERLLSCAKGAIQKAVRIGEVDDVAALLVIDCRGRFHIIGENPCTVLTESVKDAVKEYSVSVFGCCTEGESTSTSYRVPVHRNWTFSTLGIGRSLTRRYLQAASQQRLAELDLAVARGADQLQLLKRIVRIARDLLQTEHCHVRVFEPETRELVKYYGEGDWWKLIPDSVSVEPGTTDTGISAHTAFTEGVIVARPSKMLLAEDFGPDKGWKGPKSEIEQALREIHWFVSVPIFGPGTDDKFGTLSFASTQPEFLSEEDLTSHVIHIEELESPQSRSHRRLQVAHELSLAAAAPLGAYLFKNVEQQSLIDVASAGSSRDLATRVVNQIGPLLGDNVFLSLMLPESDDENGNGPSKLVACNEVFGPKRVDHKRVAVSIREGDSPKRVGISGWSYLHKKEWPTPNVSAEDSVSAANGEAGRPYFCDCLDRPEIEINFAVPILSDEDEVFGVLNAEAPREALDRDLHLPLLRRLAQACVPALKRHRAREKERAVLRAREVEIARLKELELSYAGKQLPWHRAWEACKLTGSQFRAGCEALLLLLVIFVVFFATAEFSGRRQLLTDIETVKADIERTLLTHGTGRTQGELTDSASDLGNRRVTGRSSLSDLAGLEIEAQRLIVRGAFGNGKTLGKLYEELSQIAKSSDTSSVPGVHDQGLLAAMHNLLPQLGRLSSELLLSILVILSGGLGATISVVHLKQKLTLKVFVVGVLMGVVALLALQGTRAVFIDKTGIHSITFNPYSSAFAGLLFGLFSKRTHEMLSRITAAITRAAE